MIKVETEAVNVLFTAQDKDRRLILNLKPEDVKIYENGQLQEISAFSKQIDLPLSLAILIDTSASQERTLPEEKMAAIAFLEAVTRPDKDEVAVISFTGESTLEQGMTSNLTRLRRAIDRVKFVPPSGYIGGGVLAPGTPPISGGNQTIAGSTAIWDAIWVTSAEVLGGLIKAFHDYETKNGEPLPRRLFKFPLPETIGLEIDIDDGRRVQRVEADSPAATAGIEPGDEIESLDGQAILSIADLQFVLHHLPDESRPAVALRRGDETLEKRLELTGEWRRVDWCSFSEGLTE